MSTKAHRKGPTECFWDALDEGMVGREATEIEPPNVNAIAKPMLADQMRVSSDTPTIVGADVNNLGRGPAVVLDGDLSDD